MASRVMVFVDHQNVHLIAHRRFLPSGSSPTRTHVDPRRIGELARMEVAAWSNTFRLRFGGSTKPWCHHLTARDYEAVMDPTDYTKPPPPTARVQEETGR